MKQKSKWKSLSLLTLLLALLMFATPAFAAETQTVSIDPSMATKTVGDTLSIDVNYAITNDAPSKGLSIRVHYNSKKLTFVDLTNVYASDKLGQVDTPQDDTVADLDGDANTDKQVNVTWTSFAVPSAWPGDARTLFNANFTVNAGAYNGVTNVNLSNQAPPVGITVVTENLALAVIGGKDAPSTPVLSPVTGFYNTAVSVTATVDASPIKTYYTIDGSTPDETDSEYTGPAISVDAADGAAITVQMKSYDSGEPVWGEVGSTVYTFDKTNPAAVITAPSADANVKATALTISGTASDSVSAVSKVEVSIDGGASWNDATGTTNWTYAATLVSGANAISVKVTDTVGNTNTIVGSTITYYPPLTLKIGTTDVTDGTVYVPNTAGSNIKTITASGGSGVYSTYTWLPLTQAGVGGLTAGASSDEMVYTATLGATGTHVITVQDPVDTAVFTAGVTVEVVDFSVTGAKFGYIGTPIVFTAQGNTGDVTWEVLTGAAVAGTPVISGTKNVTATVTPVTAGTFQLKATDGGTSVGFDVPVVTVYTVPDFSKLPTETVTVEPGASSAEFSISGGNSVNYTWTIVDPSGASSSGGTAATYTFPAPSTGNFAGDYTITAAEGSYSESFKIYVPLTLNPDKTAISIMSNAVPYPFTLTGAADTTPYTVTIDSLDDASTQFVNGAFGTLAPANTAVYAFDPTAYTVTSDTGSKDYSLEFDVQGLTAPPAVDMTIVPVKTFNFTGIITETDGTPLVGADVTMTGPGVFTGNSVVTDALGMFAFLGYTAVDSTVFSFIAEETGFISSTFISTGLAADGSTEIPLAASGSSVSGIAGAATAQVTIFDANGWIGGPITSDGVGAFRFDLTTAWSDPVDYTITASAPGMSGSTTVTANSKDYTGVVFALANFASPYTVTAGAEPTGVSSIDAGAGGSLDFSADPKLAGGAVLDAFGPNAVKLVIGPVEGGEVVAVALPQSKTYTDTTLPITSGTQWEINGFGNDCAMIPVPCTMAEAIGVANKSMSVWYQNSDTPGTWTALAVDPSNIYYNGDNSLIEVEICDWSANVVGIGAAAAAAPGTGTSDSSGCFINSLSASGTAGNMIAWISMIAILAAGILLAVNRKQNVN